MLKPNYFYISVAHKELGNKKPRKQNFRGGTKTDLRIRTKYNDHPKERAKDRHKEYPGNTPHHTFRNW